MANIRGITIEIDGNTTKLNKALQGSNKIISSTQSNLRTVDKLLKLDPTNVDLIKQKQANLKLEIGAVEEKLKLEKQALEQAMASGDSEESVRSQLALKAEVANTEHQLKSLEDEYNDVAQASKNSSKKQMEYSEKVVEANKKALKAMTALAGAAIAAVAGLVKKSVEAYAEYEQLVGGVETLFGKSADTVRKYAQNAYKTAGMSANQYMETVTGFSASLLQSLGGDTAKAAKIANMAIKDMSDNSNKMGTDIESIKTAYAGFSKQQYQLLDNLKLGYGGTKTEMQRLLKDAEKFSGVKYDINNLSDVYSAIHVIQDELGITGTTAKEASTTIEGLANAMKAAFDNLLTGIADPEQDMKSLTDDLASTAKDYANNLLPRIKDTLSGIGKTITENIPNWEKWKDILIAMTSVIGGITASMITYNAIAAIKTAMEAAETTTLWGLVAAQLATVGPYLLIGAAIGALIAVVVLLIKHWDQVKTKAIEVAKKAVEAFSNMKTNIVDKFNEIKTSITDKFKELKDNALTWGKDMLQNFIDGIKAKITALKDSVTSVAKTISDKLHFSLPENGPLADADEWMPDFIKLLTSGLDAGIPKLQGKMTELTAAMSSPVVTGAGQPFSASAQSASDNAAILALLSRYLPELGKNKPAVIDGDHLLDYVNRGLGAML